LGLWRLLGGVKGCGVKPPQAAGAYLCRQLPSPSTAALHSTALHCTMPAALRRPALHFTVLCLPCQSVSQSDSVKQQQRPAVRRNVFGRAFRPMGIAGGAAAPPPAASNGKPTLHRPLQFALPKDCPLYYLNPFSKKLNPIFDVRGSRASREHAQLTVSRQSSVVSGQSSGRQWTPADRQRWRTGGASRAAAGTVRSSGWTCGWTCGRVL
jgi:hypothetical protein